MKLNTKKYYKKMIKSAAEYSRAAVMQYLPDNTAKNFLAWLLAEHSPHQEDYLRMMGVAGSIELELFLLENVVDAAILNKLIHHIGLLNAYFAFETLSDNIGVGLATSMREQNPNYQLQKEILITFNDAMIKKLNGDPRSALELLAPCTNAAKQISVHQQSLAPEQMLQFSTAYQAQHPEVSLEELEYYFFSILILNIETCLNLLNALAGHPIYSFLKQSLIERYASVNALIKADGEFSLPIAADLGAKSILVMPTLAFCVGAFDLVVPNPKLAAAIKNGSVPQFLYIASSMVRLLNDMGTLLLTLPAKEQEKFFTELRSIANEAKATSIYQLLKSVCERKEYLHLLARLRKDLKHGEFNLCLDNLDLENIDNALANFSERVTYFSNLYKEQEVTLQKGYENLNKELNDPRIGQIVINFDAFHQTMYSKEFETKYGDYAITNSAMPK